MRADRIKSLLRKQPFRPISLRLTDGRNIDIRHPEQVLVTARDLFIAAKRSIDDLSPLSQPKRTPARSGNTKRLAKRGLSL